MIPMLPKLDKKTTSPSSSRGQEQDPPGGPGFQFQHLDGETSAHIHTDMHTYMQVCRVPAPAVGSSESSRTRPASEIQEPVASTVWAGDARLTFTRGENIPQAHLGCGCTWDFYFIHEFTHCVEQSL